MKVDGSKLRSRRLRRTPSSDIHLCRGFEKLESRLCLSTPPPVEPFEDVEYFGRSSDWYVNAMYAPEVWEQGFSGKGVVVAVLDSGVDYTHADLDNNIWANEDEVPGNGVDDDANGYVDDVRGWDFYSDDNDPIEDSDHGTHVAGIIAAERNGAGATGIAYSATIMALQVFGGDEGTARILDIANAIRYAVDNGADVVNLSLGGTGPSRTVRRAIEYAADHGVLIVAAAGNEYDDSPSYPAAFSDRFSNVLSVGAFDRSHQLAAFSNSVGVSQAVQVDAPGVGIYSTSLADRYATHSGTSMAAPMVSGVAAMILSADPTLQAGELRDLIVKGAGLLINGSDAVGGVNAALSVALAESAVTAPSVVLPGDIDADGKVNFADFLVISVHFGESGVTRAEGDFTGDGSVTFADFLELSVYLYGFVNGQEATTSTLLSTAGNGTVIIDRLL